MEEQNKKRNKRGHSSAEGDKGRSREEGADTKKRRKSGRGVISTIVLIIAVIVFCVSAYKLFTIYYGYHKGDKEYDHLADIGIRAETDQGENADTMDGAPKYTVDFDELWKVNKDIIAWIRFDEPSIINYPVVQGKDNKEYLDKTISGYANTYGAIFLNVYNNKNFSDKNSIIYGHHMNSKSMFGKLEEYQEKSFYDKYPYFYIYTPDGKEMKYRIFAAGEVTDISDAYMTAFRDTEEFRGFVRFGKEHSYYDTGIEVPDDAQVITLSTCTKANNEERLVVQGYKTEEK